MVLEFTVGINVAGKRESVTVAAEDARLKVKYERPNAVIINYAPTQQGRRSASSTRVDCRQG
jgi:hypothetical protein